MARYHHNQASTSRSVWELQPKEQGRTAWGSDRLPPECRSTPIRPGPIASWTRSWLARAGTSAGRTTAPWRSTSDRPAGELAACVSRVGLADRSDLVKLALSGSPQTLERADRRADGRHAGNRAARCAPEPPGGARSVPSRWWRSPSPRPATGSAPRASHDRSSSVAGGRGPLRRMERDPGRRPPCRRRAGRARRLWVRRATPAQWPRSAAIAIAGARVTWLLQSDHRALAVMSHREAPAVWRALNAAGRPFGICAVGREALARYSLLARSHPEL